MTMRALVGIASSVHQVVSATALASLLGLLSAGAD
jgi:hypothetical protein